MRLSQLEGVNVERYKQVYIFLLLIFSYVMRYIKSDFLNWHIFKNSIALKTVDQRRLK